MYHTSTDFGFLSMVVFLPGDDSLCSCHCCCKCSWPGGTTQPFPPQFHVSASCGCHCLPTTTGVFSNSQMATALQQSTGELH